MALGEGLLELAPFAALLAVAWGGIYLLLPSGLRVEGACLLTFFLAFLVYRVRRVIGWWRGAVIPDDARGMFDSTELYDFGYDDDDRRGACGEAIFGVALFGFALAAFAMAGRPHATVVLVIAGGVVVLSLVLWLSLMTVGRPRILLPAQYRISKSERIAAAKAERAARPRSHAERPTRSKAKRRGRSRKAAP